MLQLNKDVAETEAAKNRALLGNFTTTSDIKKGAAQAQADFENFNKIKRDNIVATQQLAEENTRLNRTEFDVEASIYKTSEARKKSIELEQLHKAQKSRLTDEQYDYIQSQYKEQEAIDKSNQGRAAALQMLEKSVTAQEKYNREMAKAGLLFINTRFSAEEYKKVVDGIAEEYARQSQMISGVTTAIGNSFSDAILNGKSLTDVMAGLARTIAEVTLKTQVVLPLVKALNQFLGNLFMPKDPFNQPGPYGGTNAGGWTASANGNVFDTPISLGASNVLPFARGGVVTNPKFFPMATGRGLMGESGPEAVMPLRRGPDGKLGVSAATSGGGTQVNVYNQNGGQVETKQRSSLDGGKVIDIYIKKAVAEGISSGQFDKAMGSTYGLRRQGAR
jgi:phage-related minor tail protein